MTFASIEQVANHYDMTVSNSVKTGKAPPQLVAVISSSDDLARATSLRRVPAFFELRLDSLSAAIDELERSIARLRAPLIITARHPQEGGLNNLGVTRRRELLLRFLPRAAFVDVELRSCKQLDAILKAARSLNVRRIVSVHEMRTTPPVQDLQEQARAAEALGADVFKIAARTDTAEELERLLAFFEATKGRIPISAMGMGRLGRVSRRLLARRGSALNYVHLGTAGAAGQLSLTEMRRLG